MTTSTSNWKVAAPTVGLWDPDPMISSPGPSFPSIHASLRPLEFKPKFRFRETHVLDLHPPGVCRTTSNSTEVTDSSIPPCVQSQANEDREPNQETGKDAHCLPIRRRTFRVHHNPHSTGIQQSFAALTHVRMHSNRTRSISLLLLRWLLRFSVKLLVGKEW